MISKACFKYKNPNKSNESLGSQLEKAKPTVNIAPEALEFAGISQMLRQVLHQENNVIKIISKALTLWLRFLQKQDAHKNE